MERTCRPLCGLQAGAASREDEDRLLQGCEPARRFLEPIVRLPRVQIPGEKSVGKRATCRCVARPRAREIGLIGFAAQIRRSLLTGSYVMETAEHREPCESRGSRTVLGAPGGEIPPGDSTVATDAVEATRAC